MDFSKISSQRFFVIWVCTSSKGKYTPAVLLSRFVHSRRKISPSSLRILSHTGHFRESCLPPRLPPVSSPWSRRTSDGSHSAPTRALPVASGKLSRHVQMVKSALNSHKSFCSCSMKTKVRIVCGLERVNQRMHTIVARANQCRLEVSATHANRSQAGVQPRMRKERPSF